MVYILHILMNIALNQWIQCTTMRVIEIMLLNVGIHESNTPIFVQH